MESIYALYEGCSWPPKKVICEVDEVKNGKYSFKVIVVEETVLNVTRRIEMDSIFFNGKKTQMDLYNFWWGNIFKFIVSIDKNYLLLHYTSL